MDFEYAGFWRRFVALIIDSAVLFGFFFIIDSIITIFTAPLFVSSRMGASFAQTTILAALLGWLYYTLFESSSKQATLGKMAMGIIVTDLNGNRISFGKANGRYWSKIVSFLILYIGFIMAGFTEKKQALHDIIAKCLIVKRRTVVEPKP